VAYMFSLSLLETFVTDDFVAFVVPSSLRIQQRKKYVFFSPSHALSSFTCVN